MKTADLNHLEMLEAWYEDAPAMRVTVNFPFYAATGNQSTAVVYFAIEPGHYLGTHPDSAEEIVLVLSGRVEASLGQEKGQLSAGQAVLIPAMVPHGVRNIGAETARCVGFFSAAGSSMRCSNSSIASGLTRIMAIFLLMRRSSAISTAIRIAAVPVRLPMRVWSMYSVLSSIVNSISCMSL